MKNLIVYPISNQSVDLYENIKDTNRSFDFACIYYGKDKTVETEIKDKCALFITEGWEKIRKYDIIYRCFQDKLDFFHSYDHIWIPDNDMKMSNSDIEIMFNIANENNFDLCQPSIVGHCVYDFLRYPGPDSADFREIDFVEVMCPLFNKNSLFKCFTTFSGAESAWGLDLVWRTFLNRQNMAVIYKIFSEHTRPAGQNYSNFDKSPSQELGENALKFKSS